LAGKILAILNNQKLAVRLGAAGRQLIATRFNRQRTLADTAGLYLEMITGRRSPDAGRASADGRRRVIEATEGGD
jgi:hypothetical protein